jgi:hypothetical protein
MLFQASLIQACHTLSGSLFVKRSYSVSMRARSSAVSRRRSARSEQSFLCPIFCPRYRRVMLGSYHHHATQKMQLPSPPANSYTSHSLAHRFLSFDSTSAPCVSSAATTATCPLRAAQRSGVYLRWNAHAHTRQRECE